MDLAGDIGVFVRVVEAGGFTAAARALNMTPSAVSKLVARLEDRLGARLFRRTTRRLSLTSEGEAFYQHGSRIVQDIADAERIVTGMGTAPRGLLRVSAAITFGLHQIQPLIREFLELYPEIVLELSLSDTFVDLVQEGFDLAIRAGPLTDNTLIARKLGDFGRHVVASPAYIKRHGKPATPEDLAKHNCVMFSHQPHLNQWPFRATPLGKTERPREDHGPVRAEQSALTLIQVRGSVIANNGETVVQMALEGVGVARSGEFVVGPMIRDGRLVPLLEEYNSGDRMAISAVYPSRRHLPPKVTAFVDFLAKKFLPHPPWRE